MSNIYVKCAILGIVGALSVLIFKGPYEALYVILGTAISIINLRAISYTVQLMLNGGGYAIIPLVLLKLLVVFGAIGLLLYFFQALYVVYLVAGLSTLVVAIVWQAISDSLQRH